MDPKTFTDVSAATAIIFLAVFQVVRLEATLRKLTNVLASVCQKIGVKSE